MESYSVKITGPAIDALIRKAEKLEEILYNDLTGKSSGYTASGLANLVQQLRNNYVIVNNIDVSTLYSQLLGNTYTESDIVDLLKGKDSSQQNIQLMSLHHTTNSGGDLPLGFDKLLDNLSDKVLKRVRIGAANEILENILANALGHALDTSKHKINSTASYLSTHEEERVADIEITYTQGIDKQVLLDSKSSLDNFHIGEIKNLQERAETARTKLNMTKPMSPTNYEQFAYDILTKQYSLVDVEITETVVKSDAFGHIVDLQAVYRVSQDDLDYFSAELLKNKYQNLSHPLLFVTPNGQAVKTLSQVLTDLKTGIGTVQLNNLSSSSTTVNKKVDSEYNEGLEELRKQGDDLIQKKLNVISLWYGKPTRVKD